MAANFNKTVTVTINAQGDINVVVTHQEGYIVAAKITITKRVDSTRRQVLFTNEPAPFTPGVFSSTAVLQNANAAGPGTYDVKVVCSGDTFLETITVPANGTATQLLKLQPKPVAG